MCSRKSGSSNETWKTTGKCIFRLIADLRTVLSDFRRARRYRNVMRSECKERLLKFRRSFDAGQTFRVQASSSYDKRPDFTSLKSELVFNRSSSVSSRFARVRTCRNSGVSRRDVFARKKYNTNGNCVFIAFDRKPRNSALGENTKSKWFAGNSDVLNRKPNTICSLVGTAYQKHDARIIRCRWI